MIIRKDKQRGDIYWAHNSTLKIYLKICTSKDNAYQVNKIKPGSRDYTLPQK